MIKSRGKGTHWSHVVFQSPHFDRVNIKSRFENRKKNTS